MTNISRQKLKEAYSLQLNAIVERSEKQVILAKHARRLLDLLDDTPIMPGAERAGYEHERAAKAILLDAEEELVKWEPGQNVDHAPSSPLENNLLPSVGNDTHAADAVAGEGEGRIRPTERAEENVEGTNNYEPKAETT